MNLIRCGSVYIVVTFIADGQALDGFGPVRRVEREAYDLPRPIGLNDLSVGVVQADVGAADESVTCTWVLPLPVEMLANTLSRKEVPLIFTPRIFRSRKAGPRAWRIYPTRLFYDGRGFWYDINLLLIRNK